MLSYMQGSTQTDISMAVYQCAHLCNNPRIVNERVVRRIANYLTRASTYTYLPGGNIWLSTHGVFYSPDKEKGIGCYVDSKFSGGWS